MSEMNTPRRPIKARDTLWAAQVAAWLARVGVRPNTISIASALFAGGAGLCLVSTRETTGDFQPWLFLIAAALIQVRLLCNLFDGMVAIEGGFKTKSGEIFNELPDRFADAFIFVGAGYATWVRVGRLLLAGSVRCSRSSRHMCAHWAPQPELHSIFAARWRSSIVWR